MTLFADGQISLVCEDATAWLSLNRPEKKNAINNAMLDGLLEALEAAAKDREVRSIVLQGTGTTFTSGRDTREFNAPAHLQDGSLAEVQEAFLGVLRTLADCPKPTVAAVQGFALGGGQALSLACDFVVAERSARFGNVEMAYGFPAAMNIVLLARQLGRRLGLEIAMTGEIYSAERYYEMGLVNRLAEPGELAAATRAFAAVLNSRPAWAVARTKATFRVAEDLGMDAGFHLGSQLNQLLMLASQSGTLHSGDDATRSALKEEL